MTSKIYPPWRTNDKTTVNLITALSKQVLNIDIKLKKAAQERQKMFENIVSGRIETAELSERSTEEINKIAKDGSQGRAQIYFSLDKKIDDGLERASEERSKFRNETFSYLDKIYKEVTGAKQEQKVIHNKVYKNHEPRISKLETATL